MMSYERKLNMTPREIAQIRIGLIPWASAPRWATKYITKREHGVTHAWWASTDEMSQQEITPAFEVTESYAITFPVGGVA